jgi:hypothetical protein
MIRYYQIYFSSDSVLINYLLQNCQLAFTGYGLCVTSNDFRNFQIGRGAHSIHGTREETFRKLRISVLASVHNIRLVCGHLMVIMIQRIDWTHSFKSGFWPCQMVTKNNGMYSENGLDSDASVCTWYLSPQRRKDLPCVIGEQKIPELLSQDLRPELTNNGVIPHTGKV